MRGRPTCKLRGCLFRFRLIFLLSDYAPFFFRLEDRQAEGGPWPVRFVGTSGGARPFFVLVPNLYWVSIRGKSQTEAPWPPWHEISRFLGTLPFLFSRLLLASGYATIAASRRRIPFSGFFLFPCFLPEAFLSAESNARARFRLCGGAVKRAAVSSGLRCRRGARHKDLASPPLLFASKCLAGIALPRFLGLCPTGQRRGRFVFFFFLSHPSPGCTAAREDQEPRRIRASFNFFWFGVSCMARACRGRPPRGKFFGDWGPVLPCAFYEKGQRAQRTEEAFTLAAKTAFVVTPRIFFQTEPQPFPRFFRRQSRKRLRGGNVCCSLLFFCTTRVDPARSSQSVKRCAHACCGPSPS